MGIENQNAFVMCYDSKLFFSSQKMLLFSLDSSQVFNGFIIHKILSVRSVLLSTHFSFFFFFAAGNYKLADILRHILSSFFLVIC